MSGGKGMYVKEKMNPENILTNCVLTFSYAAMRRPIKEVRQHALIIFQNQFKSYEY